MKTGTKIIMDEDMMTMSDVADCQEATFTITHASSENFTRFSFYRSLDTLNGTNNSTSSIYPAEWVWVCCRFSRLASLFSSASINDCLQDYYNCCRHHLHHNHLHHCHNNDLRRRQRVVSLEQRNCQQEIRLGQVNFVSINISIILMPSL